MPEDYAEHIRLMGDLMVLAFQADSTRVVDARLRQRGEQPRYPFIDVPEGHHDLSHHGSDTKKQEKIRKINRFHVAQLAYLLAKLQAMSRKGTARCSTTA